MKLKFGLIALLMVATSAFANLADESGTLKGGGAWKMPNGEKGTYYSTITVEKTEKGAKFKETLILHAADKADETQEMSFELVKKEHGFFDVITDGAVTGWGSCIGHLCQINAATKEAGSRWTETFKFSKRGIFRIGSLHMEKAQVSWHGALKHE